MKICARPTAQLRCPFCHDSVEVADARICPACSSAQHPACDLAHGGCAVCVVYTKRVRPWRAPARRRRFGARRRREGLAQAWGYGLGALGLFLVAIVAALFVIATISPYPSGWTALGALVFLLAGGGSLFCLGFSISGLWRAWWGSRGSAS